ALAAAFVCLAMLDGILALSPAAAQLPSEVTEPFHGVTSDGELQEGLFPVRATGVTTEPVVEAARNLRSVLDSDQRRQATFSLDSDEWRHWANFPQLERRGVPLRQMTDAQREAALDLVRAGLSARGFRQARDIMEVAGYVQELMDDPDIYGEWLYYISLFGEPHSSEPWGWQIDGYHLVVNYFVMGDQVVMTPAFWGIEPADIDEGPLAGTEVLQEEEADGRALMRALTPEQRAQARIDDDKTGNDILATAFQDNRVMEYEGLRADRMSPEQREILLEVIGNYVNNLKEGHARLKMEQVREHLDETRFAWIGGFDEDDVFYYRVQSPVILIEFDHTVPVVLDPGDPPRPSRQHIHSVIRTPNGNDYGKDLLRQHYEEAENDPNHDHGDG
ncbi:MAG: DUF3500 domain-containing protein, partial [Gemmatimonadota bacterium]